MLNAIPVYAVIVVLRNNADLKIFFFKLHVTSEIIGMSTLLAWLEVWINLSHGQGVFRHSSEKPQQGTMLIRTVAWLLSIASVQACTIDPDIAYDILT